MRKIISIISIVLLSTSFTADDDYTDGFKDGHCDGWKDVKGQFAICPIAPVAPIPDIGMDNYKGGYIKGFKRGYSDAKK
jgi:hypothetical protein